MMDIPGSPMSISCQSEECNKSCPKGTTSLMPFRGNLTKENKGDMK